MANANAYTQLIKQSAQQTGVPESILYGVLKQESGFNPKAVSPVGAQGIAQFMPATAKRFGINPLDPNQAIPAAAKYLAANYKRYGNWSSAVGAYNSGEGNMDKFLAGKRALAKETQNYIPAVLANAQKYDGSVFSAPDGSQSVVNFTATPRGFTEPFADGFRSRVVIPTNEQEENALNIADTLPPAQRNGVTRAVAMWGDNSNNNDGGAERLRAAAAALRAMDEQDYA